MIEATYTFIAGAAVFGSRTPEEGLGEGTSWSASPSSPSSPFSPSSPSWCNDLSRAWFLITHRNLYPSSDRSNEERTRPLVETGGGTSGEGAEDHGRGKKGVL